MIATSAMVSYILVAAAKASILLAVAFVVTLLLRRASAASRHVVWLATFVGVLALPFAGAVLPALRIPVLSESVSWMPAIEQRPAEVAIAAAAMELDRERVAVAAERHAAEAVSASHAAELHSARHADAAPMAGAGAGAQWSMRVFLLWLFGFVMVAIAFAVGVLRTHVLACAATPAEGDLLAEEAEVLAAELGITRQVRVMTWHGPAMPMTWGALRPVVLLPEAARLWPADRRREVLMHELAHVSRGDWTARLLAAFVCALYWFNPLAWMAARRLRDEQELACDDTVLAGGAVPADYAAHLLEVARSFRVPSIAAGHASVAMARPSQLSDRLLAMLDASRRHAPAAPRSRRLAWIFMFALTLPLAAAIPAERSDHEVPDVVVVTVAPRSVARATTRVAPTVVVETGPAANSVVATRVVAAVADKEANCPGDSRRGRRTGNTSTRSSSSSDDGSPRVTTLIYNVGDCSFEIRIVGNVRFTDDESDVALVPRGGSVKVTDDGDIERRFETSWRDGQLIRRFRVDGSDVPETAETREWLAQALRFTFARTGFNAVPRAMRAYRAGGLDSALALVDNTESDYSKRVILMALIDSVRVPPAEAARIARMTEGMSSDYERAQLLIAVANRVQLNGGVQDAMVAAAGRMSSDYERRRVLTAALARDDLSAEATSGLLRTAGQMSSDYEKVELLISYLRARPFEPGRRAALFGAANSIGSDHERRRLLTEVVTRMESPTNVIGDVTSSAEQMSSDYERAELLVLVMRKFGTSSEARAGVLRATERMSSDHEKNRVLALLARQ